MPAAGARSRSRPRAITGPGAPRRRPGAWSRRRAISSAPPPPPNCSTASSRSNGSAARSPPRPACPRCQVSDAQRSAFQQKRLVRAVRLLGQQGQRSRPEPVRPRLVRIARQRARPHPRLRTGEPDRAAGPRRVDRALGAQRRLGLLHPRRLPDPRQQRARRGASGRWSTASRARKARSIAPRSATPARAG